jgi:AraC-like DNA-binding protein
LALASSRKYRYSFAALDMISFDTDNLSPHERFDHWCEVRARGLFGVTIELERGRRPDFQGRFSAAEIGGATFAEMRASPYRITRTWADINRLPGNSLYIAHQIRGAGSLHTSGEQVHTVVNGSMVVSHSDMPWGGVPHRDDAFHFRALKIPLEGNELLAMGARRLMPQPLAKQSRIAALIEASFETIAGRELASADAEVAVRHIAQLALLARGRVASGAPESREALRHGYHHAARHLIAQHLSNPELSPALVGTMLHISQRQVHLLFEPTGLSFSRTVLAMRLDEARRQLVNMPLRPVADIAHACGFDSLATFYRTFRRAYGMTPGDVRQIPAST